MKKTILLFSLALFLGAGCASMQGTGGVPSARTGMMASKITEAEILGAQKCSPQALAKAKITLDHIMHEVKEGYYHPVWLEQDLAKAEKVVDDLLAERRAAASRAPQMLCGTDIPGGPDLPVSRKGE